MLQKLLRKMIKNYLNFFTVVFFNDLEMSKISKNKRKTSKKKNEIKDKIYEEPVIILWPKLGIVLLKLLTFR